MSITIAGATDLIKDGSGNETLYLPTVASAVNYVGVKGAATTVPVEVDALGDDSNIGLLLKPKGTGALLSSAVKTVLGGIAEGAALTETRLLKVVTALSNTTAKDIFTVTVPVAGVPVCAIAEFDFMGILGAGGAVGAGEATQISKYQLVLARTTGKVVVATLSSAIGGAAATVAGGNAITSTVATLSTITGAAGADNTFTVKVAITRSGSGADNHVLVANARLINAYAGGATIA